MDKSDKAKIKKFGSQQNTGYDSVGQSASSEAGARKDKNVAESSPSRDERTTVGNWEGQQQGRDKYQAYWKCPEESKQEYERRMQEMVNNYSMRRKSEIIKKKVSAIPEAKDMIEELSLLSPPLREMVIKLMMQSSDKPE